MHNLSLLAANSKLNTLFPVGANVEVMKVTALYMSSRQGESTARDYHAFNERITRLFDQKIVELRQVASVKLLPTAQPMDCTLPTFIRFTFFLNEQIQKFLINSPENREFEKECQKFRCELAYLRYKKDPQIVSAVKAFFTRLKSERLKIEQGESPAEQAAWEAWEKILEVPDFLDLDFAHLLSIPIVKKHQPKDSIEISVSHLVKSYWFISHQLRNDMEWVFRSIEEQIRPFCNHRQVSFLNCSQKLLTDIETFKKSLFPLLNSLVKDSLGEITQNEEYFADVLSQLHDMGNIPKGGKLNLGDKQETLTNVQRGFDIVREEQQRCQHPADHKYEISFAALDGDAHSPVQDVVVTMEEMQTFLDFQQAYQRCHILYDSYVNLHRVQLYDIRTALKTWYCTHKQDRFFKHCLQSLQKETHASVIPAAPPAAIPSTALLDVDAQVAFILGRPSVHNARPARGHKQVRRSRASKNNPAETAPVNDDCQLASSVQMALPAAAGNSITKEISSNTNSLPFKIQNAALLSNKLQQAIASLHGEQNGYLRISLRQSKMYLDDLLAFQKKLKAGFPMQSRTFLTRSLIGSAYYHLEQQLRFQNIQERKPIDPDFSCQWHNLKRYSFHINLPQTLDRSILNQLYLANFWIHSSFSEVALRELYAQHEECEIPEQLAILKEMALRPDSALSDKLPEKLLLIAEQTVSFSGKLAEAVAGDLKVMPTAINTKKFSSEALLEVAAIPGLMNKCRMALAELNLTSDHYISCKLMQLISDLQVLEAVFIELNSPNINPDEFSPLVRQAVFWQNAVLQGFVQVLYTLQTGVDTIDHDLALLYAKINWRSGDHDKNVQFLTEYFKNMNTISRYPFECLKHADSPKIRSPLHQAILQAELLREHPELNEGFKLQESMTELNFIPVQKELCHVNGICQTLSSSWRQTLELLNTTVLPQLLPKSR